MNLSGQAVGALVKFYKVPPEQVLIVYDDADLPLGTLRMRPGGGSAGQKGMVSILERLGTQDVPRLRFGIGRPPGRMPASAYVLQDFSKAELELLPSLLDRSVDAVLAFVSEGLEAAMNQFNGQGISNGA
jgi:PTH1 family peptidyl-tRNA hydrolase